MAALQCEICGGKLMAKSGGLFECEYCGMQYDKTRIQEMVQEIKGTVKVEGTVQVAGTVKVDSTTANQKLIQRMYIALKDREFDTGAQLAEQILKTDPENAEAYLGKLMAKKKVSAKERLSKLQRDFSNEPEYRNVMKYGSAEIRHLLEDANRTIVNRQSQGRADIALRSGDNQFAQGRYKQAIEEYNNAASHHDVEEKIKECNRMIYAQDNFTAMCKMACDGSAKKIQEAYAFFREYRGYAPCARAEAIGARMLRMAENPPKTDVARKQQLQKEIDALKEQKEQSAAALKRLGLFGKKDTKAALRNEIASSEEKLQPLEEELAAIGKAVLDYQTERQDLNGELMLISQVLLLQDAKVGQSVTFGRYYNRSGNQLEPLNWTVFKAEGYLYLLARDVIDSVPFGTAYYDTLRWKNSDLYKWLNNTFYNTAFRPYEKKYIVEVTEPTESDLGWRKKYPAKATSYAMSKGVTTKNGYASWFLQGNCYRNYCPDKVTEDGTALRGYNMEGVLIHNLREGVRPMVVLRVKELQ